MKKMWFLLLIIILAFDAVGSSFNEGQQYIQIHNLVINKPQVLEFFSFYCPHCYQFEHIYNISSIMKKELPGNTKIIRYHVNFLGPMGKQLTQAWAIAIALGIEDKISPLIFDCIQKMQLTKINDIRTIFIKSGINEKEYDSVWNSFLVKTLVVKQEKAVSQLKLYGVPAIFVNGKYMIKNDGLDTSSIDIYIKQLIDTINFLLNQE